MEEKNKNELKRSRNNLISSTLQNTSPIPCLPAGRRNPLKYKIPQIIDPAGFLFKNCRSWLNL
jgi:hypothetical protein